MDVCCCGNTNLVVKQVKRRRKHDSSATYNKRRRRSSSGTGTNTTLHIPDELLELILLSLDSPVELIHAASACKRWCRVVADAGFLRRFQSTHQLPIAGRYVNDSQQQLPSDNKPYPLPVFVPSPTTTMDACRFSLDFLPDSRRKRRVWDIVDSRGSILLLDRNAKREPYHYDWFLRRSHNNFQDVVVCDPLTRRYVRISPKTTFKGKYITDIYLGGRGVSIQDFKVLCLLQTSCEDAYDILACSECRYHVGVLCSNGSWREIGMGTRLMEIIGAPTEAFMYFYTGGREVITVDRRSADVSTLILPDVEHWETRRHNLRPTGGYSDGVDRIVFPEDNGVLKVFVRMDGSRELVLDKVIELAEVTRGLPWYTQHIDAGFGGGRTPRFVVGPPSESKWTFSIDVETLEVMTFSDHCTCVMEYPFQFPWPPVLRARTDEFL